MADDQRNLSHSLEASIKELQQSLDSHCYLINSLLQGQADRDSLQALLEQSPKRPRERRLEQAIKEAIEILEETRKSFKSKQLAALRKKLTDVLTENEKSLP